MVVDLCSLAKPDVDSCLSSDDDAQHAVTDLKKRFVHRLPRPLKSSLNETTNRKIASNIRETSSPRKVTTPVLTISSNGQMKIASQER